MGERPADSRKHCSGLKIERYTLTRVHRSLGKTVGYFTISKFDRRSVRQIYSGKINVLKKLPPVGVELKTATITHLKSDA